MSEPLNVASPNALKPSALLRLISMPRRMVRWLFSWRGVRGCLIGLAVLVTLFALFHAEENWRGQRAWQNYRTEMEAKGAIFDLKSLVPPPVPDDQNFAMTPLLASALELYSPSEMRAKNLTSRWKDTNTFEHLQSISIYGMAGPSGVQARVEPAPRLGEWHLGRRTDLAAWQHYYRSLTNFPSWPEPHTPAEDVLKGLSRFDPEMAELRTGSQRPFARFAVAYEEENPVQILLPHLAPVKGLTSVAGLHAIALLAGDEPGKALADVNLMFRLTDSIKDEPILISLLVRIACRNIVMTTIWEGLQDHRWTAEQLAQIQLKLDAIDAVADLKRAMLGERTFGNGIMELWVRKPAMLMNISGPESQGEPSWEAAMSTSLVPRGWFRFEQLSYNRMFDEYILSALPDKAEAFRIELLREKEDLLERDFVLKVNPLRDVWEHRALSRLLLPALGAAAEKGVISQAMIDLCRVAVALERYRLARGTYPQSLEEVSPEFASRLPLDIISRKPLRYERVSVQKFKLWSVGWNGKDDGGEVVLKGNASNGIDYEKGDWVWPQAKAK